MGAQPSQLSVYKIFYVIAGGALGASLRYGVSLAAFRLGGASFPWGTLAVNIIGSFIAGFIWALLEQTTGNQRSQAFFIIGLCGAFTTFSAYALESLRMFNEGHAGLALTNVLANNTGSILAVIAGFGLAKWLFYKA